MPSMFDTTQGAHLLYYLIFPGLFLIAGFYDLLTTRIPDWISISLLGLFFIFALASGLTIEQIAWHCAIGALVFMAGFVFFALGWAGGGDGKLAAMGALWLGYENALGFILLSFIFGALLVVVIIALRSLPLPEFIKKQQWLKVWLHGQDGLPFGLAMAAAVLSII